MTTVWVITQIDLDERGQNQSEIVQGVSSTPEKAKIKLQEKMKAWIEEYEEQVLDSTDEKYEPEEENGTYLIYETLWQIVETEMD